MATCKLDGCDEPIRHHRVHSQRQRDRRKYCSRECAHEAMRVRARDREPPVTADAIWRHRHMTYPMMAPTVGVTLDVLRYWARRQGFRRMRGGNGRAGFSHAPCAGCNEPYPTRELDTDRRCNDCARSDIVAVERRRYQARMRARMQALRPRVAAMLDDWREDVPVDVRRAARAEYGPGWQYPEDMSRAA